jgi:Rps23 Pro-64 3,4-dihydroxylase Tpa1-like proline 4-hydroxylase
MNTDLFPATKERNILDLDSLNESLNKLRDNRDALREQYLAAKPFPHLIIKDLFAPELLDRIVENFPKPGQRDWITWDTTHELKSTSRGIRDLSMVTQLFSLWLSSADFIKVLQSIVGIDDEPLIGDPVFHGAGLHEMYRDGWLELHGDYTRHYTLPLMRRFNLITYLNRDWDESWGGELVLQNHKNIKSKDPQDRAICPCQFNYTVIFPTTDKTLHGVPDKITCPPDQSRKLLSVYYWNPVPVPLFAKAGTPLVWASQQKRGLKRGLKKILRRDASK